MTNHWAIPAHDMQVAVLMFLTAPRPLTALALGEELVASGSLYRTKTLGKMVCARLLDHGLISPAHPRGHYTISERGRIAGALIMGKDPALRVAFFDEHP